MVKFEYAEIEIVIGNAVSSSTKCFLTLFHADKHEFREGEFGKVMAEMGENGWELVGATARTSVGLLGNFKIDYIFKRVKE